MKRLLLSLLILLPIVAWGQTKLRHATFNIRYDNPDDAQKGAAWTSRRDTMAAYLRAQEVDIVGMQEVLHHQLADLRERLPGYDYVGVGRDDGQTQGEYAPILYNKEKFEALRSGTFWLAEHPDSVGLVGWDGACCRIATWVRLRERQSGRTFLAINTHMDHVGQEARRQGALLIMRRIQELAAGEPTILTGDFNADCQSEVYQTLTRDTFPLRDAHLAAEQQSGPTYTFHNWGRYSTTSDHRIDFIFVTPGIRVLCSTIPHLKREGAEQPFMSDHLPVLATLRF